MYLKYLVLINGSQFHSLCTTQYQIYRKHSANTIYPMNKSSTMCSSLQGHLRGEGDKKSNMFQNKDNNTTSTKHYLQNRTQNSKKNAIWLISSTSEEEYKYSFWNFYFPLNVFTVHHIFQWELFNKWVVTLFKSWLLIACSFHGISEIANQIVFQSSFSMQYPESHL